MIRLALSSVKGKQLQTRLLLFMISLLCMAAVQAQPTGATINNPIVIGTYSGGTYNYTDTKNNSTLNNFQHNMGQASDDIYYKVIVQGTTQLNISLCGSTFDTYLHLLNSAGAVLYYNDDYGPLCSSMQSSIQATVGTGTYYIVTEGYSSNSGNLVLSLNAVVQTPVVYDTRNFIKVWEATAPETNPNTLLTRDVKDVKHSIQYFDGLGRPEQTVVKKGSLSGGVYGDIVSPVVYDGFGREVQKYLSYVAGTTNGLYKDNVLAEQNSYYSGTGSPIYNQGETVYYGYTKFESSPLNRMEESFAPGNSWAGTKDQALPVDRRSVKVKYWVNTPADAVRFWTVTDVSNGIGTYNTVSTYDAGELYKNVTENENGNQVIEFKNKVGKLILKKVQLTAAKEGTGLGSSHIGWLCTYYIYDDLNNLRAVIQPEAVKLLDAANWSNCNPIDPVMYETSLKDQIFRYEYDYRGRMIIKKAPGAGEVLMVYDTRDRLVMTQDAAMRLDGKWIVTKYDALNRLVEAGLFTDAATSHATHLQNADNGVDYPNTGNGTYELLTITHYDDYNSLPSGLSSTYLSTWDNYFSPTNNSNWPYPQLPVQSTETKGMVTWAQTKILNSNPVKYIFSCIHYDEKGRVIQVQNKNQLTNVTEVITTEYTWSGQPLISIQRQQIDGSNAQENIVISKFSYDDLGRVSKTEMKVGNSNLNTINTLISAPWVAISESAYDKLGQLKTKQVGKKKDVNGNYTATTLETLTYEYNIRGWMLGINRDYVRDAGNNNWFGFDLGYDKIANNLIGGKTYSKAQYNGNISGMLWKSKGDGEKRKYDFDYDPMNRLLKANFTQYTNGDFNQSAGINYNVLMGDGSDPNSAYDANGNIKGMTQYGWRIGGNLNMPIDRLTYSYYSGTNKLKAVVDEQNNPSTILGDFKTNESHPQYGTKNVSNINSVTDYDYDINGNLVYDYNKNIYSITYNHLNLPVEIVIRPKGQPPYYLAIEQGRIYYTYDAAGNKLQKKVTEKNVIVNINQITNVVTTTDYIGGLVFESKEYVSVPSLNYYYKLLSAGQEEGRIRALYSNNNQPHALTGFAYDYMLKDHLGNVRMVLTDEQQTNIYPVASLEDATVNCESAFYSINTSKVVYKSSINDPNSVLGYANNNGISAGPCNDGSGTNNKMYRLFATSAGADTGLSMTLKVMSGDVINIWGKSYYNESNSSGVNYNTTTIQLLSGFLSAGFGGATATGHGANSSVLNNNNGTVSGLNAFMSDPGRGSGTLPKAYVNWVLFDDQFNYVTGGFSRTDQSANAIKDHRFTDLTMSKNGYLYIYVSNESPVAVFFDNLQVVHARGPVLEETHYYPFGLPMAGISSKAAGSSENRKKYQSYEYSTDFDLNTFETFYRIHDPQIGRWWQLDPKPNELESSFATMGNNPISNIDILGDIAYYYNTQGVLLNTQEDGNDYATITVVSDKHLKNFNIMVARIKEVNAQLKAEGKSPISGEAIASLLRIWGVSYDAKEYIEFFDRHSKDYYNGNLYAPNDGKGKLVNEHMAGLELKKGYLRVLDKIKRDSNIDTNDPANSTTGEGGESDIHTHTSEGRRVKIAGKPGTIGRGKEPFGDFNGGDLSRTNRENFGGGEQPSQMGVFRVVVSPTHIYLYKRGIVLIAVDRNNTPSKNPGEIK